MVRITTELIRASPQFLNPLKDRELDLRNNKIPAIENLGATLDQYDTIDLSDNDISRLDGFPVLKRVKTLFVNNNRISRISPSLAQCLPYLEELVLAGNNMQELSDLDGLRGCAHLKRLCLMRNPVATKKHYREYVINAIAGVVLLDYRKVKQREREEALRLYGPGGRLAVNRPIKTFDLREEMAANSANQKSLLPTPPSSRLSEEHVERIKDAIGHAGTLDEVKRLEGILESGVIPDQHTLLTVPLNSMEVDEVD